MKDDLALFLEIMRTANLLTPAITSIVATIRGGREAGKDDEAIKAESMQIALSTDAEADRQLNLGKS